jgi:hypothetical protein
MRPSDRACDETSIATARGAVVAHPGEQAEEVRSLRRRPALGVLVVAEEVTERADQAAGAAGGLEQSGDQRRHRRLAVGAGDSRPSAARGAARRRRGRRACGSSARGSAAVTQGTPAGSAAGRRGRHQQGDRAASAASPARTGCRRTARPSRRRRDRPGDDAPGVVADAGDLGVGPPSGTGPAVPRGGRESLIVGPPGTGGDGRAAGSSKGGPTRPVARSRAGTPRAAVLAVPRSASPARTGRATSGPSSGPGRRRIVELLVARSAGVRGIPR